MVIIIIGINDKSDVFYEEIMNYCTMSVFDHVWNYTIIVFCNYFYYFNYYSDYK